MTSDLDARAARLVGDAVVEITQSARQLDRPDLADQIDSRLDALATPAPFQIVVAGEVKRGKTSLINGLLGLPDILPVDADVCTAVHTVVSYSDEPRCEVSTHGGRRIGVPLADLKEWATAFGEEGANGDVSSIRVGLRNPLLEQGGVLVDTPGFNGRIRGHTEITRSAVRSADAVLFTVDGDTEITQPELHFLHEIDRSGADVIVVVTKADLHGSGQIVEKNRELLARKAEPFPLVAVSNVLKSLADDANLQEPGGDRAHRLFDMSGYETLLALLLDRIDKRDLGRQINVVRSCLNSCDQLLDDIDRRTAALHDESPSNAKSELRRRRDDLVNARTRSMRSLRAGTSELHNELKRDVLRSRNELRSTCMGMVGQKGANELVRNELEAGLDAIWNSTAVRLIEGTNGITAAAARELESGGVGDLLADFQPKLTIDRSAQPLDRGPATAPASSTRLFEYIPVVSTPFTVSKVLGLVGAAGPAAAVTVPAVGLPLLGLSFLLFRNYRRRDIDRKVTSEVVARAISLEIDGPDGLLFELGETVETLRTDLGEIIEERALTRSGQLETEARELDELLRADKNEREDATRRLGASAVAIRELAEVLVGFDDAMRRALEERT